MTIIAIELQFPGLYLLETIQKCNLAKPVPFWYFALVCIWSSPIMFSTSSIQAWFCA